jgi:thiol-disulfide isomerase/thioredoxin
MLLAVIYFDLAVAVVGNEPAPVPRYRFSAGQELDYFHELDFQCGTVARPASIRTVSEIKVWVVGKKNDGSWRLVLHSNRKSWMEVEGKKAEQRETNSLAYCDLFADGRLNPNASLELEQYLDLAKGDRSAVSRVFPKLPKDLQAATAGWQGSHELDSSRYRFTLSNTPGAAGTWIFEEANDNPIGAAFLSSRHSKFFFDRKRGLIQRVEDETTQGYGFVGKGIGSTELKSVRILDDARLRQFAEEAEHWFAGSKSYSDLIARADKATEAKPLLDKAKVALKNTRDKLSLPMFRAQMDDKIKAHSETAELIIDGVKRRAELLAMPAADWKTTDLTGKPYAVKDYRGKVVVLDFWYRGCGSCIRAMPPINQLAEDFKHEPVVVLGMNTDPDPKNGLFVADKMKLTYPVLKAEGLMQKYKVRVFPTLLILDQMGKVQAIHEDYSPNLRAEVSKIVKEVLAKK